MDLRKQFEDTMPHWLSAHFQRRFVVLFFISLLATAMGCGEEKPADDSEKTGEQKPNKDDKGDEHTDKVPDSGATTDPQAGNTTSPQGDPSLFAPYVDLAPANTWMVAAIHPDRVLGAYAAEHTALEGALANVASGFDAGVTEALGGFTSWMDAATWTEGGLYTTKHVVVFGWTGGEATLDKTFSGLSGNKLRGITEVENLVYALGESQTPSADVEVSNSRDKLVSEINGFGRGWRIVAPTPDAPKALDTVKASLTAAGYTEADANGADAAFENGTYRVQVMARGEFVVIDTATFPGWADTPDRHIELSKAMLSNIETAATELPISLDTDLFATATMDVSAFGKLSFLDLLQAQVGLTDELKQFKRGKRAEPGNAMLDDLTQLRYTVYLLDPVVRSGPFSAYSAALYPESDGSGMRLVTNGAFKEQQTQLAVPQSSAGVDLGGAFLTMDVSPLTVPERGPWHEAGLSAPEWVKFDSLYKAAKLDQLPAWMGNIGAAGLWTWALPSAAWREFGADAFATLDPLEIERAQFVAGLGAADGAIVITDVGGDIEVYRKTLACTVAGSVGDCDPNTIEVGTTAQVTVNDWPYTYHMAEQDGGVRVVIGVSEETVNAIVGAGAAERPGVMGASIDFEALGNADLSPIVQEAADHVAQWVRSIEVQTAVNPEELVWTTSVDSDYPTLVAMSSVLGVGPSASINAITRLALLRTYTAAPPKPKDPNAKKATTVKKLPPNEAKAGVAKVFETRRKEIERCYQRVIQKHGDRAGTVEVQVTINATGNVKGVKVSKDGVGKGMGSCVQTTIKRWKFPPMTGELTIGKRWTLN